MWDDAAKRQDSDILGELVPIAEKERERQAMSDGGGRGSGEDGTLPFRIGSLSSLGFVSPAVSPTIGDTVAPSTFSTDEAVGEAEGEEVTRAATPTNLPPV